MTNKPMLFPEDYDVRRFDPARGSDAKPSRIKGYTEITRANDISKADDLKFREAHSGAAVIKTKEDAYKVIGAAPAQLPVEFKWLRVNGPGGAHSASALAEVDMYTTDQGFILCTKDRFMALAEAYGYEFNHSAWRVAEDGSITRGYDVALFYRSGEVARMWDRHMAEEAARIEGGEFTRELRAGGETAETFAEESVQKDVLINH
jgi:hypothetical protein